MAGIEIEVELDGRAELETAFEPEGRADAAAEEDMVDVSYACKVLRSLYRKEEEDFSDLELGVNVNGSKGRSGRYFLIVDSFDRGC